VAAFKHKLFHSRIGSTNIPNFKLKLFSLDPDSAHATLSPSLNRPHQKLLTPHTCITGASMSAPWLS